MKESNVCLVMRAATTFRALFLGACLFGAATPSGAVVGGAVDPNTITPFGGVASLSSASGATFSAVLISPWYALTAAHVIGGSSPTAWTLNLNAGGDLTSQRTIESVALAPGYTGFVPDPVDGLVHDDIAVLRLATPAPTGVPFYEIAPMAPGDALTLVGYGASGPIGGPLTPASATVKHVGSNVADVYLSHRMLGTAPLFDVYAFEVDPGSGDATLAGGDSGSPAFVNVNGAWKLVGINTFVGTAGATLSVGGGMVLSAYQPWISEVVAVPEPDTWALLAAGLGVLGAFRSKRHRGAAGPPKYAR